MLFGEYLVAKKVITEAQLLDSLIAQVRETPTLVEMVVELKLLEPGVILKVLATQFLSKMEFQAACREVGVWSNDLAVRLEDESLRRRRPVGEYLLANKCLTIESLTKVLDEFVASRGAGAAKATPQSAQSVETAAKPSVSVPQSAPIILKAAGTIEAPLLLEYFKIVSPERFTTIRSKIEAARTEGNKAKAGLTEMVNLVHGIKSAAKFVGAQVTLSIAERLVAIVRNAVAQMESADGKVDSKVWDVALAGVAMIEEVAAALGKDSSEVEFLRESENRDRLNTWLAESGVALPSVNEGIKKAS